MELFIEIVTRLIFVLQFAWTKMSPCEFCKTVIDHLVEGERGQQKARSLFLQSATDVEKALTSLFCFECAQQRVSQDVILKFVESLPQPEWVIFACDLMLQKSEFWDKCAVAVILRKVMVRTTRKALMLAEICWIQRLNSEIRAIASSSPVIIASAIGDNVLYVAGDEYLHDQNNRSVFCWKGQWTTCHKKELWRFVPASTGSSDFYIINVYADAYLYASSATVTTEKDDCLSKRVLVPRYENSLPDAAGIWQLVKLDGNYYSFYNANNDMILCSPVEAPDKSRRDAVTSTFHPLDEMGSKCREWTITSATPSKMETGLVEFFAKNYDKAAQIFTEILTMDHISVVYHTKLLCYRMMVKLMLNNVGCFEQVWAEVVDLGGFSEHVFATLCEKLSCEGWKILKQRVQLINLDEQ